MKEDLLEVVVPNAADLAANDKEKFTEIRRAGLGASDSSIVCGVNKWSSLDDLYESKLATGITEKEIEVGNKVNIRKGADLEPIVLKKFCDWIGRAVAKPEPMYRLKEYPFLTVNYDGILDGEIPVELKWVSPYAGKYWDLDKQCVTTQDADLRNTPCYCCDVDDQEYILHMAKLNGIPPYYYTQVQQQMMGTQSAYSYLVGLFDKDWEIHVFKIFRDVRTQDIIAKNGYEIWTNIQEARLL